MTAALDSHTGRLLACVSILSGLLVLGAQRAHAAADRFDVGGVTIEAPAIPGFNEISAISPEVVELMQSLIPPTNRMLGVYMTDADHEKLLAGEAVDFDRYILLQVNKEFESQAVTRRDFETIATQFKAQQDAIMEKAEAGAGALLDNASSHLAEKYDISAEMRLGEQRSLGMFLDEPDAVAFTILAKYQASMEGASFDYVMAGAISLVRLNQRIVFLYVYSRYETPDDVAWVEERTGEIANLLLAANPSAADPAAGSFLERIELDQYLSTNVLIIVVVAILGGFALLMFAIFGGSSRRPGEKE